MYYLKRIKQLGLSGIKMVITRELAKKKFARRFQKQAQAHQAATTWNELHNTYNIGSFESFFTSIQQDPTYENIAKNPRFLHFLPDYFHDQEAIEQHAAQICNGSYQFLGATLAPDNRLLWHHDTKSSESSTFEQFSQTFYQDINFSRHNIPFKDYYSADVKIPWERSRLHHLFILGWAYSKTTDTKKQQIYIHTIKQHLTSWLDNNPFLLGINWICPMDVAIRATNILWTLQLFKHEELLSLDFFMRVICSLYDHLIYLEANWEQSDKPNNHYLADLTGALYLTLFFKKFEHIQATIKNIQEQLNAQYQHQLLADGTSYEGSTAYHRLITEMHLHYSFLAEAYKLELDDNHHTREQTMIQFLVDTCFVDNEIIHIGDDDSGKFLAGITIHVESSERTVNYQNFGLSIIHKNNWHVSLRHPTYKSYQPSGHFHQDELSITIAYKRIPIIVDPGSYCYTASPFWRNQFRSEFFHNGISIMKPHEIDTFGEKNLFQLNRKISDHTVDHSSNEQAELLQIYDTRTHPITYEAKRQLTATPEKIVWNDTIDCKDKPVQFHYWSIYWSLVIHPAVSIMQKKVHEWIFCYQRKPLLLFTSSLAFRKTDGHFAPQYGINQPCTRLIAMAPCHSQEHQSSLQLANAE